MARTIDLDTIQNLSLIEKNEKLPLKKGYDNCLFCGKPVLVNSKTPYVHLLTSGYITTEEVHPDSQGLFPVGPECKNKVDKEFVFV